MRIAAHPIVTEISEYRKRYKLTQQAMADLLGIAKPSIQSIELGKMKMSDKLRCRLAAIDGDDLREVIEKRAAIYRKKLFAEFGLEP